MNPRRTLPWIALAGLVTLSGCISTQIEYDRMTGTAFPPDQTVGGKTVTIPSIYATENYRVGVTQDETNIAALTGPFNPKDPNQYDYITESELDTLERAHRSTPVARTSYVCASLGFFPTFCTEYHIYGIVVNHYLEDDEIGRTKDAMGIMWTDYNRRAFANFYRNTTINQDAGRYLRSAAHEIGHAFNLHHPDGDGNRDLMNQTGARSRFAIRRVVAWASSRCRRETATYGPWPSRRKRRSAPPFRYFSAPPAGCSRYPVGTSPSLASRCARVRARPV